MDAATELDRTLGLDPKSLAKRRARIALSIAAVLGVGAVVAVLGRDSGEPKGPTFKTALVSRGKLTVTVTATGVLEAKNQVEVGSEVSGTVKTIAVDYNDHVKAGEPLAKLDEERLRAQLLHTQAALQSARARRLESDASLLESSGRYGRLKKLWDETQGRNPSAQELETAEAAFKRAQASQAAAEAMISEAQAALTLDRANLTKAVIKSPITGLVLERRVEPGQTVAASLQAPVLFVLAESLEQMELHASVDEADVGLVKEGQKAAFGVDAYPDRRFEATITQVRFAPKPVAGVVTYEAVLAVDNADLTLRPGMTATAQIIVKEVASALLVPNAALRFKPPIDPDAGEKRGLLAQMFPRWRTSSAGQDRREKQQERAHERVYVADHGKPREVIVRTASTNGEQSEVVEGTLEPGTNVLVGVVEAPP